MKVGILTITDGQNYGNRLQNYALQQVLTSCGYRVETIRMLTKRDKSYFESLICITKNVIKYILHRRVKLRQGQQIRKKRFDDFNRKYVVFSKISLRKNILKKGIQSRYDYFVCGSDQVWNTKIEIVRDNILNHLAAFSPGKKRIAYAASFGTDEIGTEYKDVLSEEISRFKAVSVREKSGKNILHEICGRDDVEVVVDPTMLLERSEWEKISRRPNYVDSDERFILTYFLSEHSEERESIIDSFAAKYNCRVISLSIEFLDDSRIENVDFFSTAPDEFVWLISNAEIVLTDSFHAIVFSLLFHRRFYAFRRKSIEDNNETGGRIRTVLGYFGFEDRYICNQMLSMDNIDYEGSDFDGRLAELRNKGKNFLMNALTD